jgi:hypothetical protein
MTLEIFNQLWSKKANHIFTQKEFNEMILENPTMLYSYALQYRIVDKYSFYYKKINDFKKYE